MTDHDPTVAETVTHSESQSARGVSKVRASDAPVRRPANRPEGMGPASGIPAHGLRSFEPGHTPSIRHGAFSRYAIAEADELAATIAEHAPHLAEIDALALRDYAIAQVRAWRLAAWIEEHGDLDENGKPRPALAPLREWLGRAEKARARLGLDPLSRASLAVDELGARIRFKDLARRDLDEGRRLVEAADEREAP